MQRITVHLANFHFNVVCIPYVRDSTAYLNYWAPYSYHLAAVKYNVSLKKKQNTKIETLCTRFLASIDTIKMEPSARQKVFYKKMVPYCISAQFKRLLKDVLLSFQNVICSIIYNVSPYHRMLHKINTTVRSFILFHH